MDRISFLKRSDRLIGSALIRIMPYPSEHRAPHPSRILFIRPGGIGDAVLLIPAIRVVKKHFPAAAIHVLAERRNSPIFSLCPEVDRVLHYERPAELLHAVRGAYDVVIDTEQWHRLSAVVARLIGAPISVGFSTNERKKLFTRPVSYSQDDRETESFLHLIERVVGKADIDLDRPFLAAGEASFAGVDRYLGPLPSGKFAALFPGGSIAERRWGNHRFRAVAERLSAKGYGIVVVGGREDVPAGTEITRELSRSVDVCGKLSLPETAAVLQRSSLLISGDSGIMHLGYAVGCKVVALFGPGIEKKWAPRGSRAVVLNRHLPCSPCTKYGYTPRCRKETACMREITVEEVSDRALELLERE